MYRLIGGTGRSGTTILSQIFAAHPEVANVPEWRFAVDPDGVLDFYSSLTDVWTPYLYDVKLKRLNDVLRAVSNKKAFGMLWPKLDHFLYRRNCMIKFTPRYSGVFAPEVCPNYNQYVDELMADLSQFQYHGLWAGMSVFDSEKMHYGNIRNLSLFRSYFETFFNNIIDDVLTHQGALYYLEKNTWNILWFDKWLELMPKARLVHIYRDPRDIVASFTKQTWMPSDPIKSAIICRDLLLKWETIKTNLPKDTYLEISLESLVDDSANVLRKICGFWQIPWNDNLLKVDLSKANKARWRKEFNPGQSAEINDILRDVIQNMGYDIE